MFYLFGKLLLKIHKTNNKLSFQYFLSMEIKILATKVRNAFDFEKRNISADYMILVPNIGNDMPRIILYHSYFQFYLDNFLNAENV